MSQSRQAVPNIKSLLATARGLGAYITQYQNITVTHSTLSSTLSLVRLDYVSHRLWDEPPFSQS